MYVTNGGRFLIYQSGGGFCAHATCTSFTLFTTCLIRIQVGTHARVFRTITSFVARGKEILTRTYNGSGDVCTTRYHCVATSVFFCLMNGGVSYRLTTIVTTIDDTFRVTRVAKRATSARGATTTIRMVVGLLHVRVFLFRRRQGGYQIGLTTTYTRGRTLGQYVTRTHVGEFTMFSYHSTNAITRVTTSSARVVRVLLRRLHDARDRVFV